MTEVPSRLSNDPGSPSTDDLPTDRPSQTLSSEPISVVVESRAHGWRLDHYLHRLFPNYSREQFKKAIVQERVRVNGLPSKPAYRLRVNDLLAVALPEHAEESLPAENIPLDILHEDDAIIVVNKPSDMITHPGKGNYRGTLAGALQFHFDQLSDTAGRLRPGIVHRLDRHTSGVLVVAKDNQIHHHLSGQFERREVKKTYEAIAFGSPEFDSDFIETHIRVHPRHREKMQVCGPGGNARQATTFYEVITRFPGATHFRLFPRTGRTHQLRVHLLHLGHPILADRVYGQKAEFCLADLHLAVPDADKVLIARQALHAARLEFAHPRSGKPVAFEAPLPADFQRTLDRLTELSSN